METMTHELLPEMGIYIQKSKTFIWPLLNIKVEPIQTYLKFGDIDTECSRLFIALFHNTEPSYILAKKKIQESPYYNFTFSETEFDYVTFNMYNIRTDYDKVVEGKYSQLSKNFKMILDVTVRNKVVLKCLNPQANYKEFARILNVPEFDLEGKELLSPPDDKQETIFVNDVVKKQIYEAYGLVEKA